MVLLGACGNKKSAPPSNKEEAISVRVQKLSPTTFHHYINIRGTVESDKTIMITPKASGTVQEVLVAVGDRVQKGQRLAELDGEITKSQINEVKTQLELARTMYKRRKNLREDDVGSEVQYLQAKNNYKSLQSKLTTLQRQYDNYQIKTSIEGRISKVDIKEGETVGPGKPVFQVANSSALKVTAEVSEAYLSTVDETDSVRIRFPSVDKEISKRLDVVNEVIDPDNRTFGIETFISNADGKIRPNMLAKLRINDYNEKNVLVTSVNNINRSNGQNYLFTTQQGDSATVATRKKINTGASYGDRIIITSGLNSGDQVITAGSSDVSEGDAVSIKSN